MVAEEGGDDGGGRDDRVRGWWRAVVVEGGAIELCCRSGCSRARVGSSGEEQQLLYSAKQGSPGEASPFQRVSDEGPASFRWRAFVGFSF